MTRSERRLFPRLSRHLAAHQEMLGTARRSCGGARPEAEPALRRLAARQEEVDGEQRHHADHAGGDHGQGEDERHHPEDGAEERDASRTSGWVRPGGFSSLMGALMGSGTSGSGRRPRGPEGGWGGARNSGRFRPHGARIWTRLGARSAFHDVAEPDLRSRADPAHRPF